MSFKCKSLSMNDQNQISWITRKDCVELRVLSSMEFDWETEAYSSKPTLAQGDLLLVPSLTAVQLPHLMA